MGLDVPGALADTIYARVVAKLAHEPVEDFRIDFEDGYGNRPDAEEDGHADSAAAEVAAGMGRGSLPPFLGIRIKPLTEELGARALRTLDLFLTALAARSGGRLPANFVVTLPKITSAEHVRVLVEAFQALEAALQLAPGSLRMEFMIETTQSILAPDGASNLRRFLAAADGRCVAAHFGTYDYTASCNITAAHQHMRHPACDFARHMMQVAYAGTGLWMSDGATNIMPVGERDTVHAAWRRHATDIRHSLVHGIYQGWDLHPAQLPTRYAAVYAFFLEALPDARERLTNFIAKAAQATLVGDVFDDAATGQGLLNFFLRGVSCGAITEGEALATGITLAELRGRSFVAILRNRRA
jgi:citrate lyase beta subunit